MAYNWFLVLVAVGITVCLLVGIVLVMVYFGHPDDKTGGWLPKIIVLLSLYFACANVLLLPLDVANAQTAGGLDMNTAWDIAVWFTASLLFAIIPFAYFYYENDSDANEKTGCWGGQCCEGIKWALGFLGVFSLILILMWAFLHEADLPMTYRVFQWDSTRLRVNTATPNIQSGEAYRLCVTNDLACDKKEFTLHLDVTIGVFLMAMLSFLGWFLFCVFAGIGFVALPVDLFNSWKHRPKPIPLDKYAEEKRKIGQRAAALRDAGNEIRKDELNALGRKPSRKERREMLETFHRFENAVYMLKRDYYHLEVAYKLKGGNPFWSWIKLLIAIVGASMSLMWVLHIIIFMLPKKPVAPFLNELLTKLDVPGFPLFGVACFTCYTFWLFMAVLKGNFRFGLRFAFCRVYPMEINNTLLNGFLANTWLMLICSFVVVQFSATAFPIYARYSSVDLIFGTQIRYLKFFKYFFGTKLFLYALLVFVVVGLFWMCLYPRNEAKRVESELDAILKRKDLRRRDIELVSKN